LTDFSQDGEQAVIEEWAAGRVGSFLEVGAYNGVDYSNTRALMLRGWAGVAVEPAPDMCASLREAVAGFPVEVVEAACIAGRPAQYMRREPTVLRWTPGQPFSSLVQNEGNFEPVQVETVTVDELASRWLLRFAGPRLLSLDTEGTTIGLLVAFLDRLAGCRDDLCVAVEAHENVADERAVALTALEHFGFGVLDSNPVNVIASRCG
jgi:FkbM family methyltransferase